MATFQGVKDAYAVVVGVRFDSNIFRLHIKRKGESLSGIAKKYYGGFGLWPMIWLDNPEISNPNMVRDGFPLLVRRPESIEMRHRIEAVRLFNSWKDFPSLNDSEAQRKRREITDRQRRHGGDSGSSPGLWEQAPPNMFFPGFVPRLPG